MMMQEVIPIVSMKSGLEDRNNPCCWAWPRNGWIRLNEVRPGRPEQCKTADGLVAAATVSMKSGLEDRNNLRRFHCGGKRFLVSMKSGLEDRNNLRDRQGRGGPEGVSMKSGLEDRNNTSHVNRWFMALTLSQ